MNKPDELARRELLRAGFFAAASGITLDTLFLAPATAYATPSDAAASTIGHRELVKGLDGMSRVAERDRVFAGGHNAAAVMASAFFWREQKIDDETQKAMLSVIESRLLTNPIYEARPKEAADPALVDGLVKDLDSGIDTLRQSGHNIIFTNMCLKALRATPEAATPTRIAGLRKMVQSFGAGRAGGSQAPNKEQLIDLRDETKFVHFVFEEYLKAIDLYLNGKGHHGFAGHVITIGHALLDLHRAGYKETANKGLPAYCRFVQQARDGADLGGEKVKEAPPKPPTPRERAYWLDQKERQTGEIVSSHLVKYPYSFYALAKDVRDEGLKRRILAKLYYLTAIS